MGDEIKTNELRRYAVLTRTQITYRVRNTEQRAVVNPQGLIHIPGLSGPPPYNVEELLSRADEFDLLQPAEKPRTLTRTAMIELIQKVAPTPATTAREE